MESLKKRYSFGCRDPVLPANSPESSNLALVDPIDDAETRNAANPRKLSRCQVILLRFGLTVSQDLFYLSRNHFRLSPPLPKSFISQKALRFISLYIFDWSETAFRQSEKA